MCSEQLPKEFEKAAEVLPFTKYGVSSFQDFRKTEEELHHVEWLKKAGLSSEELKLYQENESGNLDKRKKIESNVLKTRLETIYNKINSFHTIGLQPESSIDQPSTSTSNIFQCLQKKPVTFYPEGHPMNKLNELEVSLFGHHKNDDIIPITKRRKILRRFERKKERILSQDKPTVPTIETIENRPRVSRPGTLWDVKELARKPRQETEKPIIGPKKQTMYTIKENKVVRLEPIQQNDGVQEYQAVDIVVPVNAAEEQLLEGTKMCLDDIKKIDRFKDYEPGIPSKILYLKNIAPSVTQEQLSLLFNQFVLENGGPVDLRLLSGRMRGQAFASFRSEELAIRALDEVNGTILSGRPVIAQFGRYSNRIQDDNR